MAIVCNIFTFIIPHIFKQMDVHWFVVVGELFGIGLGTFYMCNIAETQQDLDHELNKTTTMYFDDGNVFRIGVFEREATAWVELNTQYPHFGHLRKRWIFSCGKRELLTMMVIFMFAKRHSIQLHFNKCDQTKCDMKHMGA